VIAVMVATDRDASQSEQAAYERAERRIELCAFEVRRQDRQWAAFYEEQHRVRVLSKPDTAAVAVFHGTKQLSKRERMLAEWREEQERERARQAPRQPFALRRVPGVLHFCRHCNREMFRGTPGDKCRRCKNDPDLITARGTEKRNFGPRREAQPSITPLSPQAELVLEVIRCVERPLRDAIELRYFEKLTDLDAAQKEGVPVRVFAGYARAGVTRVAQLLAKTIFTP